MSDVNPPAVLVVPAYDAVERIIYYAVMPLDEERARLLLARLEQVRAYKVRGPSLHFVSFFDEVDLKIFRDAGRPASLQAAYSKCWSGTEVHGIVAMKRDLGESTPTRAVASASVCVGEEDVWWTVWLRDARAPMDTTPVNASEFLRYLCRVADPSEAPSLFARLLRTDAIQALDVLERGVALLGEDQSVERPLLSEVTPGDLAGLLGHDDRSVRVRAVAVLGKLRGQ